MKFTRILLYLLLALLTPTLAGCWYMAAAGAGAAGGYIMRDAGYEVQSPVAKENAEDQR